jgi:hypothetical protein
MIWIEHENRIVGVFEDIAEAFFTTLSLGRLSLQRLVNGTKISGSLFYSLAQFVAGLFLGSF